MNDNAVIQFDANNVTIAQHPHETIMTIVVPDNIAGRLVAMMSDASPVVTIAVKDYAEMFNEQESPAEIEPVEAVPMVERKLQLTWIPYSFDADGKPFYGAVTDNLRLIAFKKYKNGFWWTLQIYTRDSQETLLKEKFCLSSLDDANEAAINWIRSNA